MVIEDHAITGEGFALVRCSNCQLLFTNPRPAPHAIAPYYQSQHYISHAHKWVSPIDMVYRWARRYMLSKKRRWLEQLQPKKKVLLDVGCGIGSFLTYTRNHGWEVCGVEPNEKARTLSHQKGLKVYEHLKDIPESLFQVITLWHALEHMHDLKGTMQTLIQLLPKKGHLIIAVPNAKSWDASNYQTHWAGYDVPRHLYHFNQSNIQHLARRFKLKLVQVLPLQLDAYYVSILSEKYKNGSIFNGLISGYKSNQWAKKNHGDFSSLVYILRK